MWSSNPEYYCICKAYSVYRSVSPWLASWLLLASVYPWPNCRIIDSLSFSLREKRTLLGQVSCWLNAQIIVCLTYSLPCFSANLKNVRVRKECLAELIGLLFWYLFLSLFPALSKIILRNTTNCWMISLPSYVKQEKRGMVHDCILTQRITTSVWFQLGLIASTCCEPFVSEPSSNWQTIRGRNTHLLQPANWMGEIEALVTLRSSRFPGVVCLCSADWHRRYYYSYDYTLLQVPQEGRERKKRS